MLVAFCLLFLNSFNSDETNSCSVKIFKKNYYISWLEDAQENLGNQREMKLSSMSLKEHILGKEHVRRADGLAWCIVELAFWDNSQVPNSISLRYPQKITWLPAVSLLHDFLPGRQNLYALGTKQPSCVALEKLPTLSEPQFAHLKK